MVSESPVPLPEQPSLEQLRNQAKDLRRTSGIPLWEAQLSGASSDAIVSDPLALDG